MQKTTVKVSKEIILKLAKLKVHPRQSNEEVIQKLIEEYNGKR
jgi:predicted CopG family antitoxin